METRPATDLGVLARTYTARAQPAVPGALGQAAEDIEPTEVEVRILTSVHDAVRKRASEQHQIVADVARAVLFSAAAKVTARQREAYATRRQAEITQAGMRAVERATARARREAKRLKLDADQTAQYLASDVVSDGIDKARCRAEDKARATRLPLREYVGTEARHRLRFTAPVGPYEEARDAILASGRTIVSVVEEGLSAYAKTGRL